MRCGHEYRSIDLRHRLELQIRSQPLAQARTLGWRQVGTRLDHVPHALVAGRNQQACNHAAHAVADQHDMMRGTRLAARIEMAERGVQRLADIGQVERDRRIGGVVDLPHLVVLAQRFVAHHLIGHIDPCLRAAGQAMQHDYGQAIGIVRLHHQHAWRLDAAFAPQQRADRLAGETRACQPDAVGSGEVGSERHRTVADGDGIVAVGVFRHQLDTPRGQYRVERVPLENQCASDGDIVRLAPQYVVVGRQGRRDRDEFGTETVASVDVAHTVETQGRCGNQFRWNARATGQLQVALRRGERPASQ